MDLPLSSKLVAGLVGAALIGGLVVMGAVIAPAAVQATMASEPVAQVMQPFTPPVGTALDDTRLAKFDGDYFAVQTAPGVSLEPQSSVEIKKIGYGQVSYVTVDTTPSGVYSSDGLASGHVRYPGIRVVPLNVQIFPLTGRVLGWSRLTGWTEIPLLSAKSIGFLDTSREPASQDGVCVKDTATGACR